MGKFKDLDPKVILISDHPRVGPSGPLTHALTDPNQAITSDGMTPLFIASQNGNVDVVRELLADRRVDLNIRRTDWKDNAINTAAYHGKLEVIKLLLRCPKVKLGVKDKSGKTELDYAKEKDYQDTVNWLIF